MIARGFRPVMWVAAIGTAALGCYMLSLQVAAERAELAGIERQIILAQQDIRSLQTELGTRGRLQQLEQWNAEVLALSAPLAGQFLESNVSLARFDVRHRGLEDRGPVRLASAETGANAPAAAEARARPPVQLAAAVSPAPVESRPAVRRAGLTAVSAPSPGSRPVVQARSIALLDAGTLSDLREEAQSERAGGTRN